ncbi:MAG: electron transfer flavoprotein subunit beta/FixA family protein [Verrucomicrobiae bacterium]|nr:electron transfer flavoprotein subunit beta/FixA family protein [Verrucomicrobiae bacterium]
MNYFVLLKMVPDTVEELEVSADNKSLNSEFLRFKLNDPDEHALEQALLLKEKFGGTVTAVAFEAPEVDEVLFTAVAKGADKAVKLAGDFSNVRGPACAQIVASYLKPLPADAVILVQCQAIDDLEGEIGVYLADMLQLPYVGLVAGVAIEAGGLTVTKEFAGGMRGEFSVGLPAVLGIQAAEKPPRYVPVAKVRAVMKTAKIETVDVTPPETPGVLAVEKMYKPEVAGRAEMIEGSPEEVAGKIVAILAERGLV